MRYNRSEVVTARPTSQHAHPTTNRCWSRRAPPDPYLLHYRDVLNSSPANSPVPAGLTERRAERAVKMIPTSEEKGPERGLRSLRPLSR